MEAQTYNGLPVYTLELSEDGTSGVSAIALVDVPAIKKNFLKFREEAETENTWQAFSINEERRIVSGPLLIPDTLMYRDDKVGKYYALFTRENVEKVALRYFVNGNTNSVNLMHQSDDKVEDVILFESFLSDTSRGTMPLKGYEDCPEGTWFVSFKVMNDDVWSQVQEDKFKGFSIEGLFGMRPVTDDAETIDAETLTAAKALHSQIQKALKKLV